MLKITEHPSPQYPPRTYENARVADLTVAIALDFDTAGERLTKRAAGDRYTFISLNTDDNVAADKLARKLREFNVRTLNVAGNGIYSLAAKGWTQERLNAYVFNVLRLASKNSTLKEVISGGQTGADIAGVTAAHVLGLDTEVRLPKGFIQRGLNNQDRPHTREEIQNQIEQGAARIQSELDEIEKIFKRLSLPTPSAPQRLPRLFNIKRDKDIPSGAVYIGRGTWRGQKSLCGNPFAIGDDGNRNEVCDKFEEWAPTQPEVMAAIESLRGQNLACYCAPYRCHGDWILKMANRELASSVEATKAPATPTESLVQFDPQI
jgi:hypothetical protein